MCTEDIYADLDEDSAAGTADDRNPCRYCGGPLGEEAAAGSVARGHSGASGSNTFDGEPPSFSMLKRLRSVNSASYRKENGAASVLAALSGFFSFALGAGVGGGAGASAGSAAGEFSLDMSGAASAITGAVSGSIW